MENILKAKDFTLENVTPQIATLYPEIEGKEIELSDIIVLDMGQKKRGDLTSTNFIFRSDRYKITSTGATCGCTRPHFQKYEGEENASFVTIDFDSSKVMQNTSKWFTLYVNGLPQGIRFNLIINK